MRKLERRLIVDRAFSIIIVLSAMVALLPVFHIIGSIIMHGGSTLVKAGPSFLIEKPPSPLSNDVGGIGPPLLGTTILMLLTTIIGFPLAFLTAVMAVEYPRSIIARGTGLLIRSFIEVPTILISILIYTLLVVPMASFSVIAGAIALGIVSLPYMYTHIENALSSIPKSIREGAYGIGLTKMKALIHVFFGVAKRGIMAGLLIGLAKASGETAPLLFTVGGGRSSYFMGVDKPIDAIPLLIYDFVQTPYKLYHDVAWGAALILLAIYLGVFFSIRLIVKEVEL